MTDAARFDVDADLPGAGERLLGPLEHPGCRNLRRMIRRHEGSIRPCRIWSAFSDAKSCCSEKFAGDISRGAPGER
jgi:hypothetical protein